MTFSQAEFDIRLEWGEQGVNLLAPMSDVVIINELKKLLLRCGSGKELVERGYEEDVHLAAELNISDCVPTLQEGAYESQ